jgi:hypothetical protein
MQPHAKSTSVFAALMACAAWPVFADVTPEEVWQNWQDASAAMGQTVVAGSVARDGDVLIIDAITIASAANSVTAEGSIEQILMEDQGDGTVLVTMSPDYPLKMRLPAMEAGKPEVELNILVTQTGLRMIASGVADEISYNLTAPSIKVKLDRIAGAAAQEANLTVDATITDIAGIYVARKTDAGLQADSDITAGGMALAVVGAEPAQQSEFRATAAMTGLALKSSGALVGAALAAGADPQVMAVVENSSDIATQTTEFTLEMVEPSGTTTSNGTLGQGQVIANTSGGVMDFSATQSDAALTVNTPSVPVPDLAIALDKFAIALTAPIAPSEAALPFAFSTQLANLSLSDALWAMFDPSAALPRDPINLVIDSEGTTKLNAAQADLNAAPMLPAQLETLNLKALQLSVAGAELTGAGTSTFTPDPSGIPSPNAKLDFTLKGANGLMDKLVAAGLISPEMLTFPRMMLAMVASPMADGSDGYTSTIEIQDKAVSANGQVLYQLP